MGVYDSQITNTQRVIKAKGLACIWTQIDNASPSDTSKPWKVGAPVSTAHSVSILFLPENRTNTQFLRSLTGTDIQVGDDYGLMHAVNFIPTTRAEIYASDGKTLLRIVKTIDVLAPNGEPILYTLRFGVEQ